MSEWSRRESLQISQGSCADRLKQTEQKCILCLASSTDRTNSSTWSWGSWTMEMTTYRCFLSDLTRFIGSHCTSPDKLARTSTFIKLALLLYLIKWCLTSSQNRVIHVSFLSWFQSKTAQNDCQHGTRPRLVPYLSVHILIANPILYGIPDRSYNCRSKNDPDIGVPTFHH